MSHPQLLRLSKPFPHQFVSSKQGADYVNHAIVQQRLLGTLGPFGMRVDHIIRGPFDPKETGSGNSQRTWPARENAVVGVVVTCTFEIDGKTVEVSEVGTPEGYYMSDHDGDRLKKAMSDAVKRCAMRVGVGLDLWSKGAYVLPAMLEEDVDVEDDAPAPDHDAPDPDDIGDLDDAGQGGTSSTPEDPQSRHAPSSSSGGPGCAACGESLSGVAGVKRIDGANYHPDCAPEEVADDVPF